MDDWVLDKECEIEKKFPPFDFCGDIFTACDAKWEITFKYIPFLEVNLKRDNCDNYVLVAVDIIFKNAHEGEWNHWIASYKEEKNFWIGEKVFEFKFKPPYHDYTHTYEKNVSQHLLTTSVKFYKRPLTSIEFSEETVQNLNSNSNTDNTEQTEESNRYGFSDNLIKNFNQILEEEKFSDVIIRCGDEVFRVHKNILSARSPVFDAMFRNNTQEARSNEVEIVDIEPDVLRGILTYMYSGKWRQDTNNSIDSTCRTLAAADKYMLSGLKKLCVDALRSSITDLNALDILIVADLHDAGLKKNVLQFVCARFSPLKNSTKWKTLRLQNHSLIVEILTAKKETQNFNSNLNFS